MRYVCHVYLTWEFELCICLIYIMRGCIMVYDLWCEALESFMLGLFYKEKSCHSFRDCWKVDGCADAIAYKGWLMVIVFGCLWEAYQNGFADPLFKAANNVFSLVWFANVVVLPLDLFRVRLQSYHMYLVSFGVNSYSLLMFSFWCFPF